VTGDSFQVATVDLGAVFRVKDEVRTRCTVGPSGIGVAGFTLRLSHQRFPAIIVFDPKSPNFARYKGLKWFPVDLSCRYLLPLTPNPKPDTTLILSTRGNRRRAVRVGWFDFVAGKTRWNRAWARTTSRSSSAMPPPARRATQPAATWTP
jgi:uncharacterized protein (DUF1684 family)